MRLTLFKGCRQLTCSAPCPEKQLLVGRIDSIGEPPPTPTRDQPAAEPTRGAAIYPGVVAWAMVARREGGFAAAVAACRSERRRREFAQEETRRRLRIHAWKRLTTKRSFFIRVRLITG